MGENDQEAGVVGGWGWKKELGIGKMNKSCNRYSACHFSRIELIE
jgi:hypothetical protein